MTFKKLKFDESPVMREFGRLALQKGWITEKTDSEQVLEKFASDKADKILISDNFDQNVLTLISKLRQSNLTSLATDVEEKYLFYKKAAKDIDSKIVEQAHKSDDDELIKNIMDRHLEIMKVVEKEPNRAPTNKSTASLIHQVKVSLSAPNFKVELLKVVDYYMNGLSHLLNNVFDEQLKKRESVRLAAMYNGFKKLKEDISSITNPFAMDEWLASELDQQTGAMRYYLQNLQVSEPVKKKLDSAKSSYFDMGDKTFSTLKKQKEEIKDVVLNITALRAELVKGLKTLKEEYNKVLNNKDVDQNTKTRFESLVRELVNLNADLYKRYAEDNQVDSIYWREFSGLFKNNYPNLRQYFVQINDASDVAAIMTKMLGDLNQAVKKSYVNVISGIRKRAAGTSSVESGISAIKSIPDKIEQSDFNKGRELLEVKPSPLSNIKNYIKIMTPNKTDAFRTAAQKYLEAARFYQEFLKNLDDDKFLDIFNLNPNDPNGFTGLADVYSKYPEYFENIMSSKAQFSFFGIDIPKKIEETKKLQSRNVYDPQNIRSFGNTNLIKDIANNIRHSFAANILVLENTLLKDTIYEKDLDIRNNLYYYLNKNYQSENLDKINEYKRLLEEGDKFREAGKSSGTGKIIEEKQKQLQNMFSATAVSNFIKAQASKVKIAVDNILRQSKELELTNPKYKANFDSFINEIKEVSNNFETAGRCIFDKENVDLLDVKNCLKVSGLEEDFKDIKSLKDIETITSSMISDIDKTYKEYQETK